MAAGNGPTPSTASETVPKFIFDSEAFREYASSPKGRDFMIDEIFDEVYGDRRNWEVTEEEDGVTFLTGELGEMSAITGRLDPKTGEINLILKGDHNLWAGETYVHHKIRALLLRFRVDNLAKMAREIRPLAETAKEFAPSGKELPENVQANIASFITGLSKQTGPAGNQMKTLKSMSGKARRRRGRKTRRRRRRA
jgi:hypothetical protein